MLIFQKIYNAEIFFLYYCFLKKRVNISYSFGLLCIVWYYIYNQWLQWFLTTKIPEPNKSSIILILMSFLGALSFIPGLTNLSKQWWAYFKIMSFLELVMLFYDRRFTTVVRIKWKISTNNFLDAVNIIFDIKNRSKIKANSWRKKYLKLFVICTFCKVMCCLPNFHY